MFLFQLDKTDFNKKIFLPERKKVYVLEYIAIIDFANLNQLANNFYQVLHGSETIDLTKNMKLTRLNDRIIQFQNWVPEYINEFILVQNNQYTPMTGTLYNLQVNLKPLD